MVQFGTWSALFPVYDGAGFFIQDFSLCLCAFKFLPFYLGYVCTDMFLLEIRTADGVEVKKKIFFEE